MWPNPQENADIVTFTGEILNGKLIFLCSVYSIIKTEMCENCWIKIVEYIHKKLTNMSSIKRRYSNNGSRVQGEDKDKKNFLN